MAHLCSLFVLSCTTSIYYLKSCLGVHTQKYQQQTGHVLLNVQMAAVIGRCCVQIFRSIPKWVKSGAQEWKPHAGSQCKALIEDQVDAICGMIEEDQGKTLKVLKILVK